MFDHVVLSVKDQHRSPERGSTVTVIDPTCGGTCTADESCVEGACVANPDTGSGGGCCNTGRSNPAGVLVLMVGAGLVLRRRPRRR